MRVQPDRSDPRGMPWFEAYHGWRALTSGQFDWWSNRGAGGDAGGGRLVRGGGDGAGRTRAQRERERAREREGGGEGEREIIELETERETERD